MNIHVSDKLYQHFLNLYEILFVKVFEVVDLRRNRARILALDFLCHCFELLLVNFKL